MANSQWNLIMKICIHFTFFFLLLLLLLFAYFARKFKVYWSIVFNLTKSFFINVDWKSKLIIFYCRILLDVPSYWWDPFTILFTRNEILQSSWLIFIIIATRSDKHLFWMLDLMPEFIPITLDFQDESISGLRFMSTFFLYFTLMNRMLSILWIFRDLLHECFRVRH